MIVTPVPPTYGTSLAVTAKMFDDFDSCWRIRWRLMNLVMHWSIGSKNCCLNRWIQYLIKVLRSYTFMPVMTKCILYLSSNSKSYVDEYTCDYGILL
jgi:hypothetical protein